MSRMWTTALLMSIATLFAWGCTSSDVPPSTAGDLSEATHADTASAAGKICGDCGDAKGTDSCCSDSAEKCESCGKNKGSTLCCVELDETAAGKDLCGKCGHVAGSEACCAADAEKCECGMAKGSPLCCKLRKEDS